MYAGNHKENNPQTNNERLKKPRIYVNPGNEPTDVMAES